MEQEPKHHVINRYTIGVSIILIAAIAAATILVLKHNLVEAAPSKPPIGAAVPSQFSFAGAGGWWQGATNHTSMAVFHRVEDGCFVSAQHKSGAVNGTAEIQKANATLSSQGYIVLPASTQTLMLQTNDGPRQYDLVQSSVTSPSGVSKVMGGQEFGYLQLADGYLYIMGYCDTAAELPATIPALQAITFDSTK